MKILFISKKLQLGGIGKVLINLCNELNRKGINVEIYLSNKEGEYIDNLAKNIDIIAGSNNRLLTNLIDIKKYIEKSKPDIVLTATPELNTISLLVKLLSKYDYKVITSVHTHLKLDRKKRSLRKYVSLILTKLLIEKSDKIVAVSNGVAQLASQLYRLPLERISVIYNPLDIEKIENDALLPIEHVWFGANYKNEPVIVSAGRLTLQKDYETLLHSFSEVRRNKKCKLIIIGEGEDRSKLLKLIEKLKLQNDVDLPGFKSNPYNYMRKASLFVLSSKWEGFGNVIAEALATGTMVVSTNCKSGPAEILDNGKYGKLVPVGNVKEMANAILLALENPIEEKILKERAKEFSLSKISDQYIKLFKEVISRVNAES